MGIGKVALSGILLLACVRPLWAGMPSGPFIGSVEILHLHGTGGGEDPETDNVAVPLYSSPGPDPRVEIVIRSPGKVESFEHGYERSSAAVTGIRWEDGRDWYRLRYSVDGRTGAAWLSPKDAGQYRTLYDILHGGMAYMTDAWDRRLYKAPGPGGPSTKIAGVRKSHDALVADTAQFGENLWLLVVIVDGNICTNQPRSVRAAGWIPAFSKSGRINVWFYSRGC